MIIKNIKVTSSYLKKLIKAYSSLQSNCSKEEYENELIRISIEVINLFREKKIMPKEIFKLFLELTPPKKNNLSYELKRILFLGLLFLNCQNSVEDLYAQDLIRRMELYIEDWYHLKAKN